MLLSIKAKHPLHFFLLSIQGELQFTLSLIDIPLFILLYTWLVLWFAFPTIMGPISFEIIILIFQNQMQTFSKTKWLFSSRYNLYFVSLLIEEINCIFLLGLRQLGAHNYVKCGTCFPYFNLICIISDCNFRHAIKFSVFIHDMDVKFWPSCQVVLQFTMIWVQTVHKAAANITNNLIPSLKF